jgi:hypothetical protein
MWWQFINDSFFIAVGAIAAFLSPLVSHRIGRFQIALLKKQYDLNALKATPRIGSNVVLELRTPNASRPDVRRYFLITTIYNESELPAQKLNGNWILTCSESAQNCTVPIQWDFLGSTKYQLKPHQLGGDALTQKIISKQAAIQVDIEFTYLIPGEDAPQQYRERYKNDAQNNMSRCD